MTARLRGALTPLLTVLLAFAIGGLVVVIAGSNPLTVYRSLWVGAGFDWPFQFIPGNPFNVNGDLARFNLIATIVQTTPLILTGLAVAFAFRCGLFNIGGQGQFWVGATAGFLVARELGGPGGMVLGALAGAAGGAAWGAIPGALKAFRGAHEVISTIMLNFIAVFAGQYLFGTAGRLAAAPGQPASAQLPEGVRYDVIWGTVQGVHIGIFVSLLAAVVFWALLNRTTLGYEVRAVGYNPEAARYGGVSVRRSIVLAMAISGAFAGLAGIGEVLGVSGRIAESDVRASQLGFTGIAVALLGRNSAVGVILAAVLFASLQSGARFLSGDFSAELARSFATIIQGIIILLVGGEAIIRWLLGRRRRGGGLPDASPDVTLPDAFSGTKA
jgi:simple sugar transport system permease protein